MKVLSKYSMGIGDRFTREGKAQLTALIKAQKAGFAITPVWNKSYREHLIIHTDPSTVRTEADEAVSALSWDLPYYVDADHINSESVDLFIPHSDFFTLDVADYTGKRTETSHIERFVSKWKHLAGTLSIEGIAQPLEITETTIRKTAETYLFAIEEAGRIYRHIEKAKGAGTFVTEVSMDETDTPQSPEQLLFILAAISDEGIPTQTIAPKFTGRFNKGIDYAGDLEQFEHEFRADICIVAYAAKQFNLPENLKLSVHSGSDKFSIFPIMGKAMRDFDAGVHIKTAGTTWLEEIIGLAETESETGLSMVKRVYRNALSRYDELTGPYAAVINIDLNSLPSPEAFDTWSGKRIAHTVRHNLENPDYNLHIRQLLHVGYKVAADMGEEFLGALETYKETIGFHVTENLWDRHIKRLFF